MKGRDGRRVKLGADAAMAALMLVQMGYHLGDNRVHELTGVLALATMFVHHALNARWHASLLRGRYGARRVLMTATGALLLLAMLAVLVSAVLVSRYAFSFLGLSMRAVGRRIHMPATMWLFVLTGLHIGLHMRWPKRLAGKLALLAAGAVGAWQFIARGLYMELFMLREFAFLDYGESPVFFAVSYICVAALFAALSCGAARALAQLGAHRRKEES